MIHSRLHLRTGLPRALALALVASFPVAAAGSALGWPAGHCDGGDHGAVADPDGHDGHAAGTVGMVGDNGEHPPTDVNVGSDHALSHRAPVGDTVTNGAADCPHCPTTDCALALSCGGASPMTADSRTITNASEPKVTAPRFSSRAMPHPHDFFPPTPPPRSIS